MTQTEALLAIARRNGGRITPQDVLDDAVNEESVLHGAFTWDDSVAANKWRIHEAQMLIRECRVTVENGGRKTVSFAFCGISTDRVGPAATNPYRIAEDVAKREDLMDIAVADALKQLNDMKNRYMHLKRLSKVWDAIDEAGKELH